MRFHGVLFILLFITISATAGSLSQDFFTHQNIERNAWVYIPDNYDGSKAYPLVFIAHGLGTSAEVMIGMSTFEDIAEEDSFIVVFPEGKYTGAIFGHAWNVGLGFNQGVDDIGFIDLLIDHYSTTYHIDPARMFMTGFSQGGTLGYKYACERPGVLRAIASVAGTMSNQVYDQCDSPLPTPVLHIHGTNDPIIFYNGLLISYKSVAQTLAFWRTVNTCGDEPEITYLPNTYPDGYTVTLFDYSACLDPEKVVQHYKLVNAFHTWPGAGNDIDGNRVMWEFFKRQGQDVIAASAEDLMEQVQVFPNPAGRNIFLEFKSAAEYQIHLTDITGSEILRRKISNSQTAIEVSNLTPGTYLLRVIADNQSIIRPIIIH